MSRIEHLRISGFRRLANIDLDLRPLTVLIGANGVGKSSLLDAFLLLSNSASGKLNETLSRLGGFSTVLTRGRTRVLDYEARLPVEGHPTLDYKLRLEERGNAYFITQEHLSQVNRGHREPFKHIQAAGDEIRYFDPRARRLIQPNWEHRPFETSLSQVPRMFEEPEEFRKLLSSTTIFHALDVGPGAPVKLPQQARPVALPGEDGGELISFLYGLRETNPDCYDVVVDSIKAAFPTFDGLTFPPVAAGMFALTWKDRNFSAPFYMNELSEGTLRFLWLASLLQAPSLPTITLIDEPEISLHPELLGLLVDLLRGACLVSQVVVATHSDRLLSFLKPSEVVVMDLQEDGAAAARWADSPEFDIEKWLDEFTLGDVWNMGQMGARA